MNSGTKHYKNMKNLDKALIAVGTAILVGVSSIFVEGMNPFLVSGFVLLLFTAINFIISKPYSLLAILAVVIQLVSFGPAVLLYAYTVAAQIGESDAISISSIYVLAGTYLTAWSVWKWSTGRYALKLIFGFAAFNFLGPLVGLNLPTPNFTVAVLVGAVSVALVCIPWRRITTKVPNDIPVNVKKQEITNALFEVAKNIEGVTVSKFGGDAIDFIASKGKKKFYISVLGLNETLEIKNGNVTYGRHNLKPLIYQASVEASQRFKNANHIPVVVNYSDSSKSFAEVNASIKAEERRSRQVILTTPPNLLEILKNA